MSTLDKPDEKSCLVIVDEKIYLFFIATPTLVTDEKPGIQLSLDDFKEMFMVGLRHQPPVFIRRLGDQGSD